VTYDSNWLDLWKKRFGDPLLDVKTFRLNPDQTLAEIGNKPVSVNKVQGPYMGLLLYRPEGWAEVLRIRAQMTPSESDRMHMTGTLQKVIEAGVVPVKVVPYDAE